MPLILGMEFLSNVKPDVDFAKKVVVVHKNGIRVKLPTVALVNG